MPTDTKEMMNYAVEYGTPAVGLAFQGTSGNLFNPHGYRNERNEFRSTKITKSVTSNTWW